MEERIQSSVFVRGYTLPLCENVCKEGHKCAIFTHAYLKGKDV